MILTIFVTNQLSGIPSKITGKFSPLIPQKLDPSSLRWSTPPWSIKSCAQKFALAPKTPGAF